MTLDEFMRYEDKMKSSSASGSASGSNMEEMDEATARRVAGLRAVRDIQAYHRMGKNANADGFHVGKGASILNINTDHLSQNLYMFSPDWM